MDASFLAMRTTKDTHEEVVSGLVVKGGPEALRAFFGNCQRQCILCVGFLSCEKGNEKSFTNGAGDASENYVA